MKILYMNGIEWKQVAGRHQMMYYEMEKTGKYDCTVIDVHKVLRSHRHSLKKMRFRRNTELPANSLISMSWRSAAG